MVIVYLVLTILFEVTGTTALKLSQGFSHLAPSLVVVVSYCLSFYLLSLTLKKMEVGVVYAIWSAVGTALIATIGILWFKELISVLKIGSLALIILGVIGLNLSGVGH
jgi:small multidrug resistance pump